MKSEPPAPLQAMYKKKSFPLVEDSRGASLQPPLPTPENVSCHTEMGPAHQRGRMRHAPQVGAHGWQPKPTQHISIFRPALSCCLVELILRVQKCGPSTH